MNCFAGFEEICQPDAPLAELTWYRIGGPARWLLTPRNEDELAAVLARCRQQGVPWRMLGCGANLLVRDSGVDAAVIRLIGPVWEEVRWDVAPHVYAAAGADFPGLVNQCVERGLGGLENLAGIPGTVGGAIRMNAGGRYGEIGRYVHDVRIMDADGQISTRGASEVGFGYRRTALEGCIILGAALALEHAEPAALRQRFQTIWRERRATQPGVGGRTAGCVFKNPAPDRPAGWLLDRCGLKGLRRGAAEISQKHANFIIARDGATSQNVIDLMEHARECVRQSYGIELEPEIEIW